MTTTTQEDHVSADPFATADPFADQQPAETPAPAPDQTPVQAEQSAPESPADIPVVNAEGERVEQVGGTGTEGGTAEVGGGQVGDPAEPTEPTVPSDEQPEPPGAPADVQTAPAPDPAPAAPQEAAQPPQEPQQPAAQPEAAPQQTTPASTAESPLRHYALLYQSGEGQWTEYDLTTLADSLKVHTEVKDGVCYLKARNADHARRIAWIIFGRPENGVTVNPVAKSSWNPKRLAPAPPAPERERLSIT
jgi:hypothetical protein